MRPAVFPPTGDGTVGGNSGTTTYLWLAGLALVAIGGATAVLTLGSRSLEVKRFRRRR